jgi:hypothetical protein
MSTELSFEQIIAQATIENQASNQRVSASLADWETFKNGILATLGQDDDEDESYIDFDLYEHDHDGFTVIGNECDE